MDSEFVNHLRSLQSPFLKSRLPNVTEGYLWSLGEKLVLDCQNLSKQNNERGLQHLSVSIDQINIENDSFIKVIDRLNLELQNLVRATKFQKKENLQLIDQKEKERKEVATLLNVISSIKSKLFEILILYHEDAKLTNEGIQDIRNTLKPFLDSRQRFEQLFQLGKWVGNCSETEVRVKCNTTAFWKDMENLCQGCPLRKSIPARLLTEVINAVNARKTTLPAESFQKYIVDEIESAEIDMSEMEKQDLKNQASNNEGSYRPAITEIFLFAKEKINALRTYLEPETPISTTEEKLSQTQIALINIYNRETITRDNAKAIASKYGYSSGNHLYNQYTKLSSLSNRKGEEESVKKTQNKADRIKGVFPFLSGKALKMAEDEYNTLILHIPSKK